MKCDICDREVSAKQAKNGGELSPRGWKHHIDADWCDRCWRKSYRIIAVSFGILGPTDDWPKDEMYAAMREAWGHCTCAANIVMRALATGDVVRLPSDKKLAKASLPYVYPIVRESVPELSSGTVSALIQSVTRRYLARRLDCVWKRSVSLPTFRYPTPLQIRRQDWSCGFDAQNHPVISFRLAGARRTLRLKTAGCGRQLSVFRRIVKRGEADRSELSIYLRGKHAMAKLCAWIPKVDRASREKSGVLLVRTGADALFTAVIAGANGDSAPWVYHADDLRNAGKWHARRLQALSDDRKAEYRSPRHQRKRSAALVGEVARRQNDWVAGRLRKCASLLVGYAARRRVAAIDYDDSDKEYAASFPWSALKTEITNRLNAENIEFLQSKSGASVEGANGSEPSGAGDRN